MSVPLNQIYKETVTFEQYPDVKKVYDDIREFSIKHGFTRSDGSPKGRIYDDAVLFQSADFNNKVVCELGGRDGVFGSWLTQYASKVHVSDYFEEWGKGTEYDLGQIEYWSELWRRSAPNPDRLVVERQDLTNLSYPDNMFDVTVCTSVIEHTFNQKDWMGDMVAIREIARITKPGGVILLSTDMGEITKWNSGTLYYSEPDLFDRIVNPSRCVMKGGYNFNFEDNDNTDIRTIDGIGKVTSVVFALTKPE